MLILLDDIGFGDTSTFGGLAKTPELTKLAEQGLRFNNFNVTGMCSPTRAALLSGRNHHRVGFGTISDLAAGFPGYNSIWKGSTATIAEILRQSGYSTSAFGKWHNTPDWEITPTGPFERWPTGLGFEYFYGFMGPSGGVNHWEPVRLYRNTLPVNPIKSPGRDYHLTSDITDEAIRWIKTHASLAPEKPYFLYFAPGAVHLPHHVPKEWITRYRGKFDRGWDDLNREIFARQKQIGVIPKSTRPTPRPEGIPSWLALSLDQQRLYARQMEVYAGFVSHTDAEIGRLLQVVRSQDDGDDTLVIYIVGDNGASGMHGLDGAYGTMTFQDQLRHIDELGGPEVPINMYSMGWAWLGNTPFQWWKMLASHYGAVRAPMVVSWPSRIERSPKVRELFTHVTDVAATLYDVIGISPPKAVNGVAQEPLDGVSFASSLFDEAAKSSHTTQYFEMLGNRAIYHEGWVAAARHMDPVHWNRSGNRNFALDRWELFNVAEDFSQSRDLADEEPEKLKELMSIFDKEARKNSVYPLGAAFDVNKRPATTDKQVFTYYSETQRIPIAELPKFMQRSHRVLADIVVPSKGADGVILHYGDRRSGFSLYIEDGRLIYEWRTTQRANRLGSDMKVPSGAVKLTFEFQRFTPKNSVVNGGAGRLIIGSVDAGGAKVELTPPTRDAALYIGDVPMPSSNCDIPPPSLRKFSGVIDRIEIHLNDESSSLKLE